MERRSQERLLVWLLSYENNATGVPWVGQAVVTLGSPGSADLELVETTPGVPVTVRLDLAYFASHAAAERGARTVSTSLPDREFVLAGFVASASGTRVLDTSFLAADPDGLGLSWTRTSPRSRAGARTAMPPGATFRRLGSAACGTAFAGARPVVGPASTPDRRSICLTTFSQRWPFGTLLSQRFSSLPTLAKVYQPVPLQRPSCLHKPAGHRGNWYPDLPVRSSAPGQSRTGDLSLRRRLLYPLSYWGVTSDVAGESSRPGSRAAGGGRSWWSRARRIEL